MVTFYITKDDYTYPLKFILRIEMDFNSGTFNLDELWESEKEELKQDVDKSIKFLEDLKIKL